ncbi:alpha/beta family hydrolase [Litchfieldella rifensis]|uniref:Alpha/beta family hydrolase n=1 Tax=Litchfieldella rifensis TaxID=762643 RepID=A0ABV7LQW8_9GAMM
MPIGQRQDRNHLTAEAVAERLGEGFLGRLRVAGHGPLEAMGEARHGRVLMAHGAGAGQDSTFMQRLRAALSEQGVQSLAIEFEYMQRMREEGRRRPPPRIDRLVDELASWCDIVSHPHLPAPWLGGKSMGGRAASLLAARDGAAGLVLCGYPFHPPGKPEKTRLAHWPLLACPILVVQGTRDPFGGRDDIEGYDLPTQARVHFLEDGEHDWKPRKVSGHTQDSLIDEAARAIGGHMSAHH